MINIKHQRAGRLQQQEETYKEAQQKEVAGRAALHSKAQMEDNVDKVSKHVLPQIDSVEEM